MLYEIAAMLCAVLAVFGLYMLLSNLFCTDTKTAIIIYPDEGKEELESKLLASKRAYSEILLVLPQNCSCDIDELVKEKQLLRVYYAQDAYSGIFLEQYGRYQRNDKTERKR